MTLKEVPLNTKKNNHKNRPRRRRRNYNNRSSNNKISGGSSIEKLQKKYLLLVDSLKQKRAKYFDEFHHHDPNRVAKLRRTFEKASKELFDFEQSYLTSKELKSLRRDPDHTYSTINNQSTLGENIPADIDPLEPHLLRTQKNADFASDTEESVGTMEDYRSYKGE